MAEDNTGDQPARLYARLAAQEADFATRLAAQGARIAALQAQQRHAAHPARPRRQLPRQLLPLLLVALLVLLTPLTLYAAGTFNDLTVGPHDANIPLRPVFISR